MGDRRCCCARSCIIFDDDFNRANNTNLGSGWWELGDLEIISQQVRSNAAGSIAVCRTPHPVCSPTGYASIQIPDVSAGRRYRVFINATIVLDGLGSLVSVTDYHYAELEFTAGNTYLRIGTFLGGVADEVDLGPNGTLAADSVLSVCHDHTGLYAETDIATYVYTCIGADAGGRYAGFAAMNSGTHLIDEFHFIEHRVTNPLCAVCECDCDEYCVPHTLTLTFSASGSCVCLDGQTITLTRETVIGQQGYTVPCVWSGSAYLCNPFTGIGSELYEFALYHQGGCVTEGWLLCSIANPALDVGWDAECPVTAGAAEYHNGCTCVPLNITFGQFHASQSGDPPSECYYDLIITA